MADILQFTNNTTPSQQEAIIEAWIILNHSKSGKLDAANRNINIIDGALLSILVGAGGGATNEVDSNNGDGFASRRTVSAGGATNEVESKNGDGSARKLAYEEGLTNVGEIVNGLAANPFAAYEGGETNEVVNTNADNCVGNVYKDTASIAEGKDWENVKNNGQMVKDWAGKIDLEIPEYKAFQNRYKSVANQINEQHTRSQKTVRLILEIDGGSFAYTTFGEGDDQNDSFLINAIGDEWTGVQLPLKGTDRVNKIAVDPTNTAVLLMAGSSLYSITRDGLEEITPAGEKLTDFRFGVDGTLIGSTENGLIARLGSAWQTFPGTQNFGYNGNTDKYSPDLIKILAPGAKDMYLPSNLKLLF